MDEPDYLTLAEVADLLRVNVATVRRWANDGSLPALKIGSTYRVERRQLDALRGAAS